MRVNATTMGHQNFDPGSNGPNGPYSCLPERPPLRFFACVFHSPPTPELTAPTPVGVEGDIGCNSGAVVGVVEPGEVDLDNGV